MGDRELHICRDIYDLIAEMTEVTLVQIKGLSSFKNNYVTGKTAI